MRILIIEDEASALRGLRKKLQKSKIHNKVVNHIESVQESIIWLKQFEKEIDIIFMDIYLKDGSCFEIFRELHLKSPIIFCTAYEEYAIRAFEVNSIGYLLKPFSQQDVDDALEKYKEFHIAPKEGMLRYTDLMGILEEGSKVNKYRSRLLVKIGNKYHYLNVVDIAHIYIENKIVYAQTFKGKVSPLNNNIEELERLLPPDRFFRINRQEIVAIQSIENFFNDYGRLTVRLKHQLGKSVYVSRKRVEAFRAWLDH